MANTPTTAEPSISMPASPTPEPTPTATLEPTPTVTFVPRPSPVPDPRPREIWVSLGEFKLTAYCGCTKCCGKWGINRPLDADGRPMVYTANQSIAVEGLTVAADISLLPYGTVLYIDGHKYVVQDCGSAIKGKKLDIYFEHHSDAWAFGVKHREVYIIKRIITQRSTNDERA
ncbi:MAG: 3D domain-containing protein [Oscillospiraceae bacterium]|nr:3D domain-containing protein [Oscillospiraceae bacterium]